MQYKDRQGMIKGEDSFQDRLLSRMYGCVAGRFLLGYLVKPSVSKWVGRLLDSRISSLFVPWFVRANHIDISMCEKKQFCSYNDFFTRKLKKGARTICEEKDAWISPCDGKLTVYPIGKDSRFRIKRSYNDFFTRKLKKGARTICEEKDAWISPCDGKLTVYPIGKDSRFRIKRTQYTVEQLLLKKGARTICEEKDAWISPCDGKLTVYPIGKDSRFRIKRTQYTVEQLLRNAKFAKRYQGGYAWIFRLSVEDYHRYCYVADGEKTRNIRIPGVFHTCKTVSRGLCVDFSTFRGRLSQILLCG